MNPTYESLNHDLGRNHATRTLKPRHFVAGREEIDEGTIDLKKENIPFIFSDGVSQSRMNKGRSLGWSEDVVTSFIEYHCASVEPDELIDALIQ